MLKFSKVLLIAALLGLTTNCYSAENKEKKAGDTKITLSKSNVVVMDSQYTDESVARTMLKIQEADAKLPFWEPIYLVILSPGGSIDAGLELIDNINALDRKVHTVTLFAASMGFQNVEGVNGTRFITSTGTLMSHKAKGEFSGEFPGQLDSRYQYYLNRIGKLDQVVVDRSGGKLTLEKYKAMYENEYWCEGQACVNDGVADAVAKVKCDKTLSGTRSDDVKFSFLGMPITLHITKAACPTITGVLELKVDVEGKRLRFDNLTEVSQQLNITVEKANELRTFVDKKVEEIAPKTKTAGTTK